MENKIEEHLYKKEIRELKFRIQELESEVAERDARICSMEKTISWRITLPIRKLGQLWDKCVESVLPIHLLARGLHFLRKEGIGSTFRRVSWYLGRSEGEEKLFGEDDEAEIKTDEYVVYDSKYEDNVDFSKYSTDVKPITFFLPQFHTFPENDKWWGKGFTEWVNTRKAVPKFEGHYQPRTPHEDIGYYDLSQFETLKKQITLAKQHGIYAFCFYYYWFSGHKLMEKPIRMLYEHPEIDMNYCLCWANENFTRAWDGKNKEVIMRQKYQKEDAYNFICDIKEYCMDTRYVRVDGKPVVIVYNPGQIPDAKDVFDSWRKYAIEQGIGEIQIWTCQTANNTAERLGILDAIDAEVEFPPHNMWWDNITVNDLELGRYSAGIFNYHKLVKGAINAIRQQRGVDMAKPLYRGCMMGWDNAARRENGWTTYIAYSLKDFYRWISEICNDTRQRNLEDNRYFFVNAWNEWAEGTYLEPDEKYGYANINTLSRAIYDIGIEDDLVVNMGQDNEIWPFDDKERVRIAVQVHLFYTELAEEIIENLNYIPYRFDCYISTSDEKKRQELEEKFKNACHAEHVCVEVYENRGRDVAPFLLQMQKNYMQYDYICHIHGKKTKTADYGDTWRKYLYHNLFDCSENVKRIIDFFEKDERLGILFPETYPALKKMAVWGGNRANVKELLKRLRIDVPLDITPVFPVGNMFWVRTLAAEKLFDYGFASDDFDKEKGQDNATLAHAIERAWVYIVKEDDYTYRKMQNVIVPETIADAKKRIAFYLHFDKENKISQEDAACLGNLAEVYDRIVFISNSTLDENELDKVRSYVHDILLRENKGYDFAGWRDAILDIGWDTLETYDEMYLVNNSMYGPIFDMKAVISEMEDRHVDFWGLTKFPYLPDGSYLGKTCIEEHVQSFFMEFDNEIIRNSAFREFWESVQEVETLKEVVAKYESELTPLLKREGFRYDVFIQESDILCQKLESYMLPYEYPYQLLLLGMPFVKKKSFEYMNAEERRGLLRYLELCKQI